MSIRLRHRLQAMLVGVALAATGCTQAAISEPPAPTAKPADVAAAAKAVLGSNVVLKLGNQIVFADGLTVVLVQINDSRCPAKVACVWAGEISPQLILRGGGIGAPQTVMLGSQTNPKQVLAGYAIVLVDAALDSATIMVTKAGAAATGKP